MADAEGKVGPQVLGDGSRSPFRMSRDASQLNQDSHARYQEAVQRGGVFIASTGTGGVAPGTALSTTPPFILYNPPSSGVELVIWRARIGYVSGTLGAGTIVYASGVQTSAPSGGTALTPKNAKLGSGKATAATANQGGTITAPTILAPAFTLGAFLASTASVNPPLIDEVAGEFTVAPGAVFCMQGVTAAGSSPLVIFGVTWEEVPLI